MAALGTIERTTSSDVVFDELFGQITRLELLPGTKISEGTAIGAMSLVLESTRPWSIYVGVPANFIKARHRDIEKLEREFLNEHTV